MTNTIYNSMLEKNTHYQITDDFGLNLFRTIEADKVITVNQLMDIISDSNIQLETWDINEMDKDPDGDYFVSGSFNGDISEIAGYYHYLTPLAENLMLLDNSGMFNFIFNIDEASSNELEECNITNLTYNYIPLDYDVISDCLNPNPNDPEKKEAILTIDDLAHYTNTSYMNGQGFYSDFFEDGYNEEPINGDEFKNVYIADIGDIDIDYETYEDLMYYDSFSHRLDSDFKVFDQIYLIEEKAAKWVMEHTNEVLFKCDLFNIYMLCISEDHYGIITTQKEKDELIKGYKHS